MFPRYIVYRTHNREDKSRSLFSPTIEWEPQQGTPIIDAIVTTLIVCNCCQPRKYSRELEAENLFLLLGLGDVHRIVMSTTRTGPRIWERLRGV